MVENILNELQLEIKITTGGAFLLPLFIFLSDHFEQSGLTIYLGKIYGLSSSSGASKNLSCFHIGMYVEAIGLLPKDTSNIDSMCKESERVLRSLTPNRYKFSSGVN